MRYVASDNNNLDDSLRKCGFYKANRPKLWGTVDGEEKHIISSHFSKFVKIYDADICGDERIQFLFSSGKCFELNYIWWIEYNPEWDLLEDLYIDEITKDKLDKFNPCDLKDRDWLLV